MFDFNNATVQNKTSAVGCPNIATSWLVSRLNMPIGVVEQKQVLLFDNYYELLNV